MITEKFFIFTKKTYVVFLSPLSDLTAPLVTDVDGVGAASALLEKLTERASACVTARR